MSWRHFLAALRARIFLFATVLTATVAAAAILSLLLPKSYLATASLVIDARNEQSMSDALNALMLSRERMGYIQTQVDIIKSQRVARKVVDELKLAEHPPAQQRFVEDYGGKGTIERWIADRLLRSIEVKTSQSSVIDVSFFAEDPEEAADVANAFADAYMNTMLELRVEPTRVAAAWFDDQLKALRADLELAQQRLADYQQQHGIVSNDERLDLEHERLAGLSSQLLRAQQETAELQDRDRQLRLAVQQGLPIEQLPDARSSEAIQNLQQQLVEGRTRLTTLAAEYGANYPEYRLQAAEIRGLEQQLDAELQKLVSAITARMQHSEQREASLQASLEAQQNKLLKVKDSRSEFAVLVGNVETAQRTYETAMQKFVVSQVESRASQANVTLLNPATPPGMPHRPNIPLNIALSVIVGMLLGVCLVMMLEMGDRPVRSAADIDEGLDVPVIGILDPWSPAGTNSRPLLPAPPGSSRPAPSPVAI